MLQVGDFNFGSQRVEIKSRDWRWEMSVMNKQGLLHSGAFSVLQTHGNHRVTVAQGNEKQVARCLIVSEGSGLPPWQSMTANSRCDIARTNKI